VKRTAYRPLARLLRCPANEADAILGDAIVETAHRVMAAVFDGDPQPLFDIILDPGVDEFIRSRMCEALAMIALGGELDRDLVARFLRDAFNELRPQRYCFVWAGWQSAIAMLGLRELKVLVKRAFNRGFINRHILGFDDFEDDLRRGIQNPGEPWRPGFLVTRLKSCPDGPASRSETTRTGRSGGSLPSVIASSASRTIIHSRASAETTPFPAAAGRNSRNAACSDALG